MKKNAPLFLLLLLFFSCYKEKIVFNNSPNENYELPLLLKLDDKNCVFDAANSVLKYSIDQASLENYSPVVKFQVHSRISFESIALINAEINHFGDLELNKEYQLSIHTAEESNHFTLIFTDIPIIQIVSHDDFTNGAKNLSKMILNYPEKGKASNENWTGIEYRGNSSLKYPKKSFGIGVYSDRSTELPSTQAYFDFPSSQKWVLNAMFIDLSRLRNMVSFDLWKQMDGSAKHIGIDSKFVEVFINHETQGLYAFSENYSADFFKKNEGIVLYKSTKNSDMTKFDALPEKNPNSGKWRDWEQILPDPATNIVWEDFESFSTLVLNSNNSIFQAEIAQQLDLENAIDYYLFVNLCYAYDNVGKNWWFLKESATDKFSILPWDLDSTWGRTHSASEVGSIYPVTNGLFKRLEAHNPENYNRRLKDRWAELRSSTFSERNLMNLFETRFNQLAQYNIIALENKRWQADLNLELEQKYIRTWLQNRLVFLDKHFDN